jgi:predicted nucleic acid-binding protein
VVRRLSNLVVSCLARVEVPAAVWRKQRIGELSAEDAAALVDEFEWDWYGEQEGEVGYAVVGVTNEILEEAARSVARHSLRAFDAVQLASALAARAADASVTDVACFDEILADAARAEGFTLLS